MTDETIGMRIKRLRQSATPRITQDALGKHCDVTRQAVNQWEQNRTTPSGASLLAAAQMFGVSPNYLLYGEGNPTDHSTVNDSILAQAIEDALNYMASTHTRAEDNLARFAEVVSIQYRVREREAAGDKTRK